MIFLLSLLSDFVRAIANWYLLNPRSPREVSRERDAMSNPTDPTPTPTAIPRFALAPLPDGMFALVMAHESWGAKWFLVVPQMVSEVTNQSAIDTLVHLEPVAMGMDMDADALVAQFRAQLDGDGTDNG